MALLLEDGTALLLEDGTSLLLEDGFSGGVETRIGTPPLNTSLRTVVLASPTNESLEVDVYCSADPTATDPGFAVTAEGTIVADDASYTAGAWSTGYGTDGWATARTPTFGTAGTIDVTPDTRIWLWIQTTAGSEIAVWRIGTVIVL